MGTSEKFCLKWNDFEKNVSKSFSQLRQQTGLFDVTLVSSDQKPVSAHRLVLSACSHFFKNIFHSNTHSHPLLYLDGVSSEEVNLMLNYVYQGEVQIYQESLDRFLEIAKKFKLDGLLAEETTKEEPSLHGNYSEERKAFNEVIVEDPVQNIPIKPVKDRTMKVLNQSFETNNAEVEEKFQELVVMENNEFRCTVCEKTMNKRFNMRQHLETHLTGLSYDCNLCGKTFRSAKSLINHKQRTTH